MQVPSAPETFRKRRRPLLAARRLTHATGLAGRQRPVAFKDLEEALRLAKSLLTAYASELENTRVNGEVSLNTELKKPEDWKDWPTLASLGVCQSRVYSEAWDWLAQLEQGRETSPALVRLGFGEHRQPREVKL